jgi:uncharacterized protein (DUF433 family)
MERWPRPVVALAKEPLMSPVEVGEHLAVQSRNGRSRLVFKGTRYSVAGVFRRLARGESVGDILLSAPELTQVAIREAIDLATGALVDRVRASTRDQPEGEPKPVGRYLVMHPHVCFGKLTFDGTRVPVATVLTFLGLGYSFPRIQEGWPRVKQEAVVEAIKLAAAALVETYATVTEGADESTPSGRKHRPDSCPPRAPEVDHRQSAPHSSARRTGS